MFWVHLKKTIKSIFRGLINKTKNTPFYGRSLVVILLVAMIIKGFVIYFSYKNLDPRTNCISYIYSDIIILFFVQLLITINSWLNKRPLRLFNDIIIILILIIYCVDIFTIYFFQSRVSINEAVSLGSNGSLGFADSVKLRISLFLIIGTISFLIVQIFTPYKKSLSKRITILFSISCVIYAIFYASILVLDIDIQRIENIFTINIQSLKNTEDSSIDTDDTLDSYDDYLFNIQGEGKDLNVILVFAESISAIDSANMGGNNNMPYFDKIQDKGIKFTNFITNGTTSDTAHISTLYGIIPLINMGANNTPYSGYKLLMEPLPEYLNTQGYKTTFISAAGLSFLDQRTFLSGAGFQKIIGEEEFTGSQMYAFESAPDGDLYSRTLQEIQNQTGKFFIGLQTISFHKPYNTPLGKTESLALQYSDQELFKFYQSLQKIGFFDSGILVIVGDHRKMNPAEPGEYDKFGANWYTRAVATVVGSGIVPGTVNDNIIQHTDFYNSLKKLLGSGPVKIDKTYNDIFTDEYNRDWGITNAEFYEINRYTVSSLNHETFLFKNLSNLLGKNMDVYNYFSSYLGFEFGDKNIDGDNIYENSTKFIGHRGNIKGHPENTLESFLAAKEQGAVGIEFDVSYTQDKENIVAHGNELYSSNCHRQKVGDYTLDWITKNCTITNGEKYKTLQEMLELIDGIFDYYFLEIKVYDEDLGEQQTLEAIQTVRDLNMLDRVIFISYSDSARDTLNSQPDVIFGRDAYEISDLDFLANNNCKYFLAPYDLLTPEIINKVQSYGKQIATYTVNNTGDFQSMNNLGINIIMTDELELLENRESETHYPVSHSLENLMLKKSSR